MAGQRIGYVGRAKDLVTRYDIRDMRIGAFDLPEPVPTLRDAHALVMIRPWVDVGSVGT